MEQNCHVEAIQKTASEKQIRDSDRALLSIGGMGCSSCATRVRNGLLSLEGVFGANIYLNLSLAEVYYDSRKVSTGVLKDAVERAGNDGRHEYHAVVIAVE
jgi:copper chaperone CopZ